MRSTKEMQWKRKCNAMEKGMQYAWKRKCSTMEKGMLYDEKGLPRPQQLLAAGGATSCSER